MNPDSEILKEKVGPLAVRGWLAFFLVVAVLLRIVVLLRTSMWIDDGATLAAIRLGPADLVAERFRMGHFPWFFLLFKGWSTLAGTSLLALRFPSLLACVATIPIMAMLAGRLGGARAAVVAAGIAAVHGTLLRFSAELRMYSWMALLGSAMTLAAVRHAEKPTAPRAALLGVLHLALLQLHVSAFVWSGTFFVVLGALAARQRFPRAWWIGYTAALLVPAAITLPVLLHLRAQVDMKEFKKFDHPPQWRQLFEAPYELLVSLGATAKGGHVWKLPLGFLAPIVCVVMLARWRQGFTESKTGFAARDLALLFVGGALLPPTLAFLVSRWITPILGEPRYYIAGTGPLLALIGAAAASARWEKAWAGRLLLAIALAAGVVVGERTYDRVKKVLITEGIGINSLVREIEGKVPAGSTVVLSHSVAFPELAYFYFHKPHRYDFVEVHREASPAQVREALAGKIPAGRDAVLFVYKLTPEELEESQDPEDSNLYKVVAQDFGPWAGVTKSKNEEPGYFWFRREGAP